MCSAYPGLTPDGFARLPLSTMRSLLRHLPTVHMQSAWPDAQVALLIARTMGGHKGNDVTVFLPPWGRPVEDRRPLVSPGVDRSIRAALDLGLVSQDVFDLLTEVGFQP